MNAHTTAAMLATSYFFAFLISNIPEVSAAPFRLSRCHTDTFPPLVLFNASSYIPWLSHQCTNTTTTVHANSSNASSAFSNVSALSLRPCRPNPYQTPTTTTTQNAPYVSRLSPPRTTASESSAAMSSTKTASGRVELVSAHVSWRRFSLASLFSSMPYPSPFDY